MSYRQATICICITDSYSKPTSRLHRPSARDRMHGTHYERNNLHYSYVVRQCSQLSKADYPRRIETTPNQRNIQGCAQTSSNCERHIGNTSLKVFTNFKELIRWPFQNHSPPTLCAISEESSPVSVHVSERSNDYPAAAVPSAAFRIDPGKLHKPVIEMVRSRVRRDHITIDKISTRSLLFVVICLLRFFNALSRLNIPRVDCELKQSKECPGFIFS